MWMPPWPRRQPRLSQGRDCWALLIPWLPFSPAPAPAIPCLADSFSARADCMLFSSLDTLFACGPLLSLSSLPGVSQSRQTNTDNKQGALVAPYSSFSSQIMWHRPCPLFSPSLPSPGCACRLNPPTPARSPSPLFPGEAIAFN